MQISTHWYGEALVLQVTGALDHDNGPRLKDHLMVALQKLESGAVIIDMSGVEYVSSAGFKTLVSASKTAKEAGNRLLVAAPQPMVVNIFKMSHAQLVLSIFPTMGEATSAVSERSRKAYDSAETS